MAPTVFAIHCHPDDIEFTTAGTLLLLKKAGCTLHYMNVSSGYLGSVDRSPEETRAIRREEGRQAAAFLGAEYHESILDDLEVFYTAENVRKLLAIVREVKPDIILTASPQDYMEDHMNAGRLAVGAAFARGIPHMESIPPRESTYQDVVLYHAMPHGLRDMLRNVIIPDFAVDITSVIDEKEKMLSFHESQKKWLDVTQGFDSYLKTMRDIGAQLGTIIGGIEYAEGWRRHVHLGLSAKDQDPLQDLLKDYCIQTERGREKDKFPQ
jgi:LmbE family N-acetylglucosaminyl deacetylase